ncbi:AAA family ATPase [Solitalea sp. MAHUQ-68]|uniref:AAA family ATPase n=1 Tax=Solitalea agri TaxID=2953739 RepID=A0A9X2F1P9_9SPHI|nr:AAA family ATPase [Solitalea agri]MCO4293057.1 AAA family ATPase [Solitalea agri]
MSQSLIEIAQNLKEATHKRKSVGEKILDVKVQLIYAFNGTGKTRLSREFKKLIVSRLEADEEINGTKVIYYNAFTEDLFFWDNDTPNDIAEPKLKIQPNSFTNWILEEEGQDQNIIANFQNYTNDKLTPHFSEDYSVVRFSFERGNDESPEIVKISKGEESCFIWSVFHSLLEQIIDVLNIAEQNERSTNKFNDLEYIFIDDPVSSLDENHLIELAVEIAKLIKSSKSELKFIITTHNPLFYNVLHNELKDDRYKKYILKNLDDGTYNLLPQANDSPFSYHLYLKSEIEKAIETGQLSKFHYNFLRNILEKTSTFLGYTNWGELLPEKTPGERDSYLTRIINISSHSKHANEEVFELTANDKRVLGYLMKNTKIFEFFKS